LLRQLAVHLRSDRRNGEGRDESEQRGLQTHCHLDSDRQSLALICRIVVISLSANFVLRSELSNELHHRQRAAMRARRTTAKRA
jgi:hypothetical protein